MILQSRFDWIAVSSGAHAGRSSWSGSASASTKGTGIITSSSAENSRTGQAVALSPGLVGLMAVTCGMNVANLYYNQPLLAQIGHYFRVTERQVGAVPLLTQIGTAAGMLLFVPLGDIRERRTLIVRMLVGSAGALAAAAAAPSLPWLVAASVAIGLTSVVSHLVLPFAAEMPSLRAPNGAAGPWAAC
jgi:predicted MFS family arabinose efflux permease